MWPRTSQVRRADLESEQAGEERSRRHNRRRAAWASEPIRAMVGQWEPGGETTVSRGNTVRRGANVRRGDCEEETLRRGHCEEGML